MQQTHGPNMHMYKRNQNEDLSLTVSGRESFDAGAQMRSGKISTILNNEPRFGQNNMITGDLNSAASHQYLHQPALIEQ